MDSDDWFVSVEMTMDARGAFAAEVVASTSWHLLGDDDEVICLLDRGDRGFAVDLFVKCVPSQLPVERQPRQHFDLESLPGAASRLRRIDLVGSGFPRLPQQGTVIAAGIR